MKKYINNRYFEWKNERKKEEGNVYSHSAFRLKNASYRVMTILFAINLFDCLTYDKSIFGALVSGGLLLFSLFDKESNTWDFTTKRLLKNANTY